MIGIPWQENNITQFFITSLHPFLIHCNKQKPKNNYFMSEMQRYWHLQELDSFK